MGVFVGRRRLCLQWVTEGKREDEVGKSTRLKALKLRAIVPT